MLVSTKDGQYKNLFPSLSWDGRADGVLVPFVGPGDKYRQIYLLDSEGKRPPTRIPGQDAGRHHLAAVWSPDGKSFVFISQEPKK